MSHKFQQNCPPPLPLQFHWPICVERDGALAQAWLQTGATVFWESTAPPAGMAGQGSPTPDGVQSDNDHPSGPVSRSACSPSVNRSHRLVKTHSLIPQATRFCPRQRPECLSVETSPRWLSGASVRPARPKTSRRTHSRAVHDFEIPPRRLPRNLQRAQRLHDTHLSLSLHPCTISWQALQQGLPTIERRHK